RRPAEAWRRSPPVYASSVPFLRPPSGPKAYLREDHFSGGRPFERHEWLDLYIFETIEEVQRTATEWLWTYNNERPNMGIGGVTPA
uniref:integrase core domain-containing protein n=1 Tax=Cereibacter azotoformans TaxID=43057 RepID=UPI001F3419F2